MVPGICNMKSFTAVKISCTELVYVIMARMTKKNMV